MLVMKLNTRQSCASVGECRCQGQRSSQATLPSLVHVAIYSAILLLSCFAATLAVGSEGDSVARPAPAASAKHIVEIIRRSGAVVGRTAVDDRVHLSLSKPSNIPAETEKTVPATGDTRRSRRGKTREAATSGDSPAADHGMAHTGHSDLIDNFLSAIMHSTLTRGAEYTRVLRRETHDTWPQASRSSRPVPWSTPEAQQKWNAVEDNSSDIQVPPLLEVQCTKAYSPTLRTLHPNDISSISHPMLVMEPLVIREHAMTDEYHAMLLLSVPTSYNDTFPVSVTHLSVYLFEVEGERGQTWRIHDRIDISFLPESCRNPRNVIGTVVASTSRKFVFIYGYGARLECNQTIVYNPSKRRHRLIRIVSASGRGRGPERKRTAALSSHSAQPLILGGTAAMLAIRDITNPNGTESILMFGGTGCELSNIFAEHCQQFSNDVHVLQLSGDNFEIGSWTTRVSNSGVLHPCPTPRIASLLLNADASDGPTLFVYGGMSLSSSGGTETGRYPLEAECDLWQFHASRREWTKLTHLKENCEARAASSCFAWNRLPLRPFGAYSQGAGELAIVNIAFSDGAVPLACFESSLSISRITIRGTRTGNWSTVKQTTTTNFAPELMQDVSRIRALGFLYHNTSLFMVQTSIPFTVNLSVEFDYVTGQPSVAWRALPGEDPMYSFPGNVGCITMQTPIYFRPRPHEEGDESFGEPYTAMIGGFCMFPRYAYSRRAEGDTWPEPSWKSLPIWSYSSHAHEYIMRVIKPGPPFADRFCHSLLQLFDSTRPKAVIYGGIPLTGAPPDRHVWCFDWLDQYWRIGNLTNRHQTPERSGFAGIGHSAVTLSNTSFLLYGGMEWDPITGVLALALNQTYVFTFSDLSTCTGSWRQVSTARPMPRRMMHTATVHDGKVIVGGGFTSHFQPVNHALLSLTIVVSRSRVTVDWTPIPLLPTLLDRIMYSLASFSKSTLLIVGGVKIKCLYNYKDHRAKKCLSIPSYLVPLPAPLSDLRNMTTLRHTNVIPFFSSYPMIGHSVVGSVVYGGILLPFPNLANPQSAVFSDKTCHYNMAPHHCPLGHGWVNDSCKACDVNFYSSDLSGICTECGPYLITNSTASKECSALDPCYKDFCHGHGECLVNHRKATCSCNWGYLSYDNCQLPLVIILIVTGTVILALIVLFVWRRVRQSQKLFRQREQDLQVSRWQLRQLANGVLVKWGEIAPSIKRIIGSGSSGDVFLAELSDLPVAVKVLRRGRMDDFFLQQFIRELDLMRTVRHPNIVIFLGAGTKPPQRSPFIVMEYVMRESLFKILSEHASHAISCQRKIDFATDIASGMEFLHSSEPPRIHCDLKSSNLLVTSKWKVKIADFGMLRLLSTIDFYGRMDPEENLVANTAACAPGFNHVTMPIPRPFTATPDGPEEEHDTEPLLTCAQRAEHSDLQPQVVADCRNHAATTSMRVEGTAGLTQAMGTSRWCSPETLTDGVFDEYTDVYSYGVVLWEILTHDKPYNEQDDENDVIRGIKNGERLPLPPGQELYELKRITEDCWSKEAKSRPLFPEILGRLNLAR